MENKQFDTMSIWRKVLWFLGIVVVIMIIVVASRFYQPVSQVSSNIVEINMTAQQFKYNPVIIQGPKGVEVTTDPSNSQFANTTITVIQGHRIILHLTSTDVPHGFGIYEYNIFLNIPVGETITVEFLASKAGRFFFYCTVFCGTGHPNHQGILLVKGG